MVHSFDVMGFTTTEGDILCPTCDDNQTEDYPIFADSEWDYQPYCDECGNVIENVTILENEYVRRNLNAV